MDVMGQPRPRRRRPPTRGLLFGAPLDRVPVGLASAAVRDAAMRPDPPVRPDPVPIALIGESTPVAPPRVTAFGAMAASWPLSDRPPDRAPRSGEEHTDWATFASSVALAEPRRCAGAPVGGVERRWGGLSAPEWQRLLGR